MFHTNIPASYAVFVRDNDVLLLQRANTWYQDGKYSLVSGHVDPGESFTNGMIREAKEEVDVLPITYKTPYILHRKAEDWQERIDAFFLVTEREWELINNEPGKCSDLAWFDRSILPDNIIPYINYVLDEIDKWETYGEYWRE